MSARGFDEKWLEDFVARGGRIISGGPVKAQPLAPTEKRSSKYGNTPTESGGRRFDSKHEEKVYQNLRLRALAGEFIGLGMQVIFYLPGGVKYIADFVTLGKDGTYTVYDAKSEATRKDKTYRLKKRLMRECLGIVIEEV